MAEISQITSQLANVTQQLNAQYTQKENDENAVREIEKAGQLLEREVDKHTTRHKDKKNEFDAELRKIQNEIDKAQAQLQAKQQEQRQIETRLTLVDNQIRKFQGEQRLLEKSLKGAQQKAAEKAKAEAVKKV
jgi:DNA repair ATPase RecN